MEDAVLELRAIREINTPQPRKRLDESIIIILKNVNDLIFLYGKRLERLEGNAVCPGGDEGEVSDVLDAKPPLLADAPEPKQIGNSDISEYFS